MRFDSGFRNYVILYDVKVFDRLCVVGLIELVVVYLVNFRGNVVNIVDFYGEEIVIVFVL